MAKEIQVGSNGIATKQPSMALVALGVPAVLFTAILAGRMLWEETFLTFRQGPQMLGFSLAHGRGALLFLAPFLLCLWLFVALITMAVCLWRKRSLSRWYWLTLASAIVTIGVLSIPPAFWQWAFIGTFAKSPHAGDLMVYAAAEGDVRTVLGYLEHGVPVAATNYEGSTAAFTAAVGGSLPVIKMLVSKGADLNTAKPTALPRFAALRNSVKLQAPSSFAGASNVTKADDAAGRISCKVVRAPLFTVAGRPL